MSSKKILLETIEKKFSFQYPAKVFNYYLGKCYSAESLLLGVSGLEGEYLTLMGDSLIKEGNLSSVILVDKSIGGTTVSDWGYPLKNIASLFKS